MRSGHGVRVAVFAGVVFAMIVVICQVFAERALAQSAQVVCVDPHNTELVARITGQTRDLPLRVRWVDSSLHAPPSEAELRALARRHSADFVVALRAVAGGHSVYVYSAKARALRTREVPRPARGERFSSSAAAEAVALIVRGELSAALASLLEPAPTAPPEAASGAGGTPSESSTNAPSTPSTPPSERTPEVPPKPVQPAPEKPASPPAPEEPVEPEEPEEPVDGPQPSAAEVLEAWFAPPLRLSLGASMRASIPAPDHVLGAPTLQLQLKLARFGIALHGSTSFGSRFAHDDVAISVHRHAAQLELFAWFRPSEGVEIALGPAAGVVFYQRTSEQGALASTRAKLSSSPSVSALAEVRWHFAHSVGLSVRMGLDFILRPVRFTYRADPSQTTETSETTLARLAKYEPWVAAGLFVDFAE